jgi:hypothetical protein
MTTVTTKGFGSGSAELFAIERIETVGGSVGSFLCEVRIEKLVSFASIYWPVGG